MNFERKTHARDVRVYIYMEIVVIIMALCYKIILFGGKGGRCVWLTALPP
jgi:hypothetical protein